MQNVWYLGVQFFGGGRRDYLLVLGIVMVTSWLMFRYRKKRRTQVMPASRQEYFEDVKKQRGLRGDLEDLMVEIEQMAKRLSAHLDAKTVYLDQLIEQADQRIETLKLLQDGSGRADPGSNPPQTDLFLAGPGATSEIAGGVADAVQHNGGANGHTADPLAASIYEMADRGMPAADIAKELDEHIGKVELILALRKT